MEKIEIECRDLSKLGALWHSRTLRTPTQGTKPIKCKSSSLPKTESLRLRLYTMKLGQRL